jgi:hypothetical protein
MPAFSEDQGFKISSAISSGSRLHNNTNRIEHNATTKYERLSTDSLHKILLH